VFLVSTKKNETLRAQGQCRNPTATFKTNIRIYKTFLTHKDQ